MSSLNILKIFANKTEHWMINFSCAFENCLLPDAEWLPDDCLVIAWQLPDDWLMTDWWLPDDCMMTVWQLPDACDDCMMTARKLPYNFLMAVWICFQQFKFSKWLQQQQNNYRLLRLPPEAARSLKIYNWMCLPLRLPPFCLRLEPRRLPVRPSRALVGELYNELGCCWL